MSYGAFGGEIRFGMLTDTHGDLAIELWRLLNWLRERPPSVGSFASYDDVSLEIEFFLPFDIWNEVLAQARRSIQIVHVRPQKTIELRGRWTRRRVVETMDRWEPITCSLVFTRHRRPAALQLLHSEESYVTFDRDRVTLELDVAALLALPTYRELDASLRDLRQFAVQLARRLTGVLRYGRPMDLVRPLLCFSYKIA